MSDLIRREDAIEAIHSYWKGELSKMPTTDSEYGEVIDGDFDTLLKHNKELSTRINAIPSADRPQGEWKHLGGDEWLCSECGYVIWTEGSWEHPLERGKDYCEHCGAKMKGADDE